MTDKNTVQGRVIEALPSVTFKVALEGGKEVRAQLSGKMKLNWIKVNPGDRVAVVLSPDGSIGRIVRRL